MNRFVGIALGAAVGTLLYTCFTYLRSEAHAFDWGRAMVDGSFVSLGAMIFSMAWPKKNGNNRSSTLDIVKVRNGSLPACRDNLYFSSRHYDILLPTAESGQLRALTAARYRYRIFLVMRQSSPQPPSAGGFAQPYIT